MFSAMGNGFTFEVETITFWAICKAAGATSVTVFGDDIICPKFIFGRVKRLLEMIGCILNVDKTFAEGPFRESCGHDYFLGVNIRGVYVKRLDTPQDRYSVINQLNLFSARTGLSLSKTVGYLTSKVKWLPVPSYENDDAGIRVPRSCLFSSDIVRSGRYQSLVYSRMVPIPLEIKVKDDRLVGPRKVKRLLFNPDGLLVSFLQGSVKSGSISIRHDRVRYRKRLGNTFHWDALPMAAEFLMDSVFWQQWETAVSLNLNR